MVASATAPLSQHSGSEAMTTTIHCPRCAGTGEINGRFLQNEVDGLDAPLMKRDAHADYLQCPYCLGTGEVEAL